jgi:hypothetical protein
MNQMTYGKDFTVSIPHFYSLEYTEGDHVMTIEMDFREETPGLYFEAIKKWNPPHEGEAISDERREEILKNIAFFLTHIRKFRFQIER